MTGFNYFNYFTEIEEYFWKKRGAHLLVSPLDWAILETWQQAEIPLPTVLRGIDRAFESYARSRRGQSGRQLKSLAYCVDAVLEAAEEEKEAAAGTGPAASDSGAKREQGFSREDVKQFIERNRAQLEAAARNTGVSEPLRVSLDAAKSKVADLLIIVESPAPLDLEDLERRLTVIEEKISAALSADANDDLLVAIRRDLDRQLAPYRRKMNAAQLEQLERHYIHKRLFEERSVPRLSLFYLS
jgi:DNA-binding transcriptional MerR regulator